MDTLTTQYEQVTRELEALQEYLDLSTIFQETILEQSSLKVTNCICLALGTISGRSQAAEPEDLQRSMSQLVFFERIVELLSESF